MNEDIRRSRKWRIKENRKYPYKARRSKQRTLNEKADNINIQEVQERIKIPDKTSKNKV